jgi:hypothetical protein
MSGAGAPGPGFGGPLLGGRGPVSGCVRGIVFIPTRQRRGISVTSAGFAKLMTS